MIKKRKERKKDKEVSPSVVVSRVEREMVGICNGCRRRRTKMSKTKQLSIVKANVR